MVNSNNKYYSQNTTPQDKYQNNQDILDINFEDLYNNFITPIDLIRSHYNALVLNSQELNTPQYQESRQHAFYRMIGFPVVADANNFYSPGYDPNLNLHAASIAAYKKISDIISNNLSITNQFAYRESIPTSYNKIFSSGGIVAQGITLGSVFIRNFDKQLGETDPLTDDKNKNQIINQRNIEVENVFVGLPLSIFNNSLHPIKPFVVDPRIDNSIRPIKNRICAPFLIDKTQTKIFISSNGSSDNLKRPFIEKAISTVFDNSNTTLLTGKVVLDNLLANINSNKNIKDQDLLDTASNPAGQFSSAVVIFNNYIKIIQIVVEKLVNNIKKVQYIRQRINFKPIPDPKNGVEGGGTLNAIDPNDGPPNNKEAEVNIIKLMQKQVLSQLTFDIGLQGVPDPGDFAFSNLDDMVFSVEKNVKKSYDDNLNQLNDLRNNSLGNPGIEYLKNIEIIMGEFSGIGLIDMIAIQAALFAMDPASLLGLIDVRAFERLKKYRTSTINLGGTKQNDVITALTNFEKTLKNIYLYIQFYYNSINDGTAFTA
jgi:hypothetical protein